MFRAKSTLTLNIVAPVHPSSYQEHGGVPVDCFHLVANIMSRTGSSIRIRRVTLKSTREYRLAAPHFRPYQTHLIERCCII